MTAARMIWRNRASSLAALALSLIVSLAIFALAPLLLDQDVRDTPIARAPYLIRMPVSATEKPPRPETADKPAETPDMAMPMPDFAIAPPKDPILQPPLPAMAKMAPPAIPTAGIALPAPEKSAVTDMPAPPIQTDVSPAGAHGRGYRLDQVDTRPGAIQRMQPAYPHYARRRRIEGRVKIAFLIDRYGRVKDLQIMESSPAGVFDKTVMDTVSLWRFHPATKADQAVDVQAQTTIEFKLD